VPRVVFVVAVFGANLFNLKGCLMAFFDVFKFAIDGCLRHLDCYCCLLSRSRHLANQIDSKLVWKVLRHLLCFRWFAGQIDGLADCLMRVL